MNAKLKSAKLLDLPWGWAITNVDQSLSSSTLKGSQLETNLHVCRIIVLISSLHLGWLSLDFISDGWAAVSLLSFCTWSSEGWPKIGQSSIHSFTLFQGPTRGMGAAGARLGSGLPPPIIPVGSTVGVGSTGGPGNPGPGGKPTNTAPLGTGQLPSKDDKSWLLLCSALTDGPYSYI